MNKVLFGKVYSDESLYDLPEDMADWMDEEEYRRLPEDEDGFKRGEFHVSIIWKDE